MKGGAARDAGAVENTFMRQVVELHDKYMEVGPTPWAVNPERSNLDPLFVISASYVVLVSDESISDFARGDMDCIGG